MQLDNGRIRLELDDQTGEIVRIVDTLTGLVHIDARGDGRDDARLFRLILPTPDWFSRYTDSHEVAPPKISRQDNAIIMRWENLTAAGQEMGVCAEVRVAPLGTDEIGFTLTVVNGSDGDVIDVCFPIVGGWTAVVEKPRVIAILSS